MQDKNASKGKSLGGLEASHQRISGPERKTNNNAANAANVGSYLEGTNYPNSESLSAVNRAIDYSEITQSFLGVAKVVFPDAQTLLYRVNRDKTRLVLAASIGSDEFQTYARDFPASNIQNEIPLKKDHIVTNILHQGKVHIVDDYDSLKRIFLATAEKPVSNRREEFHRLSATCFPLIVEEKAVGLVVFLRKDPLNDSEQRQAKILIRPLTKLVQHQRAEAAREARYHILLERISDIVWMTDADLNFIYVNPAVAQLCGHSVEEVRSLSLADLMPSNSLERIRDAITTTKARLRETELEQSPNIFTTLEVEGCYKDGSMIPLEFTAYITLDENGDSENVIGITRSLAKHKKPGNALQRSERKFRHLLEALGDSVFILDKDNRLVDAHVQSNRFHISVDKFLGKTIAEIMPPEASEQFADRWEELRGGETVGFEYLVDADKDPLYFSAKLSPIMDNGAYQGAVLVVRDVTEYKKARKALQKSEQRYRDLVENSPDMIYLFDAKGNLLYGNPSVLHATRCKPEELLGKHFTAIVSPDDLHLVLDAYQKNLQGETATFEIRSTTQDGQTRWFSFVNQPVLDNDGNLTAIQGIGREITERVKADEALRQLSRAVEQSANMILITDVDGTIEFINPAFTRITGYSPDDAIGHTPRILKSGRVPRERYEELWGTILRGEVWQGELLNRRKNGELYWDFTTISAVKDMGGQITHFVAIKEDVTARKAAEEALRRSEERFRSAFENTSVGMSLATMDGSILRANCALVNILGYSSEELQTMTLWDYIHPDDVEANKNLMKILLSGELPSYEIEQRHIHKDGHVLWVVTDVTLVRGEEDEPLYAVIFTQDITKRKQTEVKLQQRAVQLEALRAMNLEITSQLDLRSVLKVVVDKAVEIVSADMGGMHLYNASSDSLEWVVTSDNHVVPPGKTLGRGEGLGGTVWKTKEPLIIEDYGHWHKRIPDAGASVVGATVGTPILWGDEFFGVLVVNSMQTGIFSEDDVRVLSLFATQAAVAIRNARLFEQEREARLKAQSLQAAMQVLSSSLDLPNVLNAIISELRRVVPYDSCSVAELKGNYLEIIAGAGFPNWDKVRRLRYALNDDDSPSLMVVTNRQPLIVNNISAYSLSQYERSAHADVGSWLGVPLLDKGKPIGLISINKREKGFFNTKHADVVQAFAAQASIAFKNARLFTEVEEARMAAERANRAKSIFLANMSHELRTPLNAILGFAQLLERDESLSPEQRENMTIIAHSGNHLLHMIGDILEISKIESGQIVLSSNHFDLYKLLDDIESTFALRTRQKGLAWTIHRADDLPQFVFADASKIRQVLTNLVGNAIKFTSKGRVAVNVRYEEANVAHETTRLIFEVEDTGPGITPDERERLFQPFYQSESGRKAKTGTGLGLSIAREYARMMGGDLTVQDTPTKKGVLFVFTTKIKISTAECITTSQPRGRVIGVAPEQPTYRILVVEDNAENRSLMQKILDFPGLEVRAVADGLEGVKTCIAWRPHLIFMDVQMPVMNGYEAATRIKSTPEVRDTPIIAITAAAFKQERDEILKHGYDDFIIKPLRIEHIFDILEARAGIQFIRAKPDVPSQKKSIVLNEQDLKSLPRELIQQLNRAAGRADLETSHAIVEKIRSLDTSLADKLTNLLDDFRFDTLLQLTARWAESESAQ